VIVVRLMGGLGNQMFQYAAGRQLAHVRRTPLKLDLAEVNRDLHRSYRLGHLSVTATTASAHELARFQASGNRWVRTLRSVSDRLLPATSHVVVKERTFRHDPGLLERSGHVYLWGYWQSEKYFQRVADVVRTEFAVNENLDAVNARLLDAIRRGNSVSLHVRHGDYASNPEFLKVHGLCPPEYYTAALDRIGSSVQNPEFFVFSDEPDWARQHLEIAGPAHFIDNNGSDGDYLDLHLMSQCKHHIIANSSFSWWGAWLARNPHKSVIAPSRWFSGADLDTSDLIPADWIRI
jgi:hypothetical protein